MSALLAGFVLASLTSCSSALSLEQRYRFQGVRPRLRPPHKKLTLAVLPFRDARQARGDAYGAQQAYYDTWVPSSEDAETLARIVARHLHRGRVFAKVVVGPDPKAHLVLEGEIRQLRNLVSQRKMKAVGGPQSASATSEKIAPDYGEVIFQNVEVRTATSGRVLAVLETGAFVKYNKDQIFSTHQPVDEALFQATSTLERELVKIKWGELSGVPRSVSVGTNNNPDLTGFPALVSVLPETWDIHDPSQSIPIGWVVKGSDEARLVDRSGDDQPLCEAMTLKTTGLYRYAHRQGIYEPSIDLWSCAANAALEVGREAKSMAPYIGADPSGSHVFVFRNGRSNWPEAIVQIGEVLQLSLAERPDALPPPRTESDEPSPVE